MGPITVIKLGPTSIQSGCESGLDSKTGSWVFLNLPWKLYKIQVKISIFT